MMQTSLLRASLAAATCILLLGLVAFWPSPKWQAPPRPRLKAPIAFDELQSNARAPSEQPTTP